MSFNIRLMTNNSADNVADKDFTTIDTLTGVLRDETSVINPTIRIEADVNDIAMCNYFYIPQFHRYYFVSNDGIRSIRNGVVEISGHTDVLTTAFKLDNLSDCLGITKKQENKNNLLLNDGSFRVYQDPIVTTKLFPSGFNSFNYVLAVAGGRTASSAGTGSGGGGGGGGAN